MKKKSPPYAIIVAALLGLVAIFAAYKWKQGQDATRDQALANLQKEMQDKIDAALATKAPVVTTSQLNMRNVFYANQPIVAGTKVSEALCDQIPTQDNILPDAYTSAADIDGSYAIRNIEKGDPLTPRNIGKSLPYLSQRISPGMRAVSLPIFNSEDNNTGGFAVDGDKVDLLYSTLSQDSSFILKTELVMQNLSILYVPGPKIESDQMNGIGPAGPPGDPITITFEVTPEQAQALVFMTHVKNGQFSMILRARADKSEIKIKPFVDVDYYNNLQKIQKTTDKSQVRVQQLADKIAAEEAAAEAAKKKTQGSPGNTNETTNPLPPPQ